MSPKEEAAALTQEAGHVVGISERRSVVKSWTRRSVLEERIEEHPELPSRSHVAPLGVSELVPGLSGSCQSPSPLPPSFAPLEPGPLPSTGFTPLPGYCGPLRHPERPSLSFAGCRLARAIPPPRLPVSRPSPASITPAESAGARVAHFPTNASLPCITRRIGFRITRFEARSAFTHVAARMVAGRDSYPLRNGASARRTARVRRSGRRRGRR